MTAQITAAQIAALSPEMQAHIAALAAKAANAKAPGKLSFKVTAKKPDGSGSEGALSVYGLGRFPTTLYRGQWERLLNAADEMRAFIEANAATLTVK